MTVAISLVSTYLDKILALSGRIVMLYGNLALGTVNVEKNEKQAGPIDGRPKMIANTRLTLRFGLENPDWVTAITIPYCRTSSRLLHKLQKLAVIKVITKTYNGIRSCVVQ